VTHKQIGKRFDNIQYIKSKQSVETQRHDTYLQAKVHVIALIAREPDETVRSIGPEHEVKLLVAVSSEVRGRHQLEVVHDPRVSVEVSPATSVWSHCDWSHGHVRSKLIEQVPAIQVEVTHVAVEGCPYPTAGAGLAEDDGVNIEHKVLTRQHGCKQIRYHLIK